MVHNTARQRHCVPPLTWDWFLARQAQKFADTCPCGSSSPDYRAGAGESLAWGYPSAREAAEAWYDELTDFHTFEDGGKGSIGTVRHFTQMIWQSTTRIGCGYRSGCLLPEWNAREEWGFKGRYAKGRYDHVYVCHYLPHGNDLNENCPAGKSCREVLSGTECGGWGLAEGFDPQVGDYG